MGQSHQTSLWLRAQLQVTNPTTHLSPAENVIFISVALVTELDPKRFWSGQIFGVEVN